MNTPPRPAQHLLLATGGTGGHVFPALALADHARTCGWRVSMLGSSDGPEGNWAQARGVAFEGVTSGKLDRSRPSPIALARATLGVVQATTKLMRLRPAVVVGFGGFASLPGVAAARLVGVPLVLHETNAVPGLVTRRFARAARLVITTQAATRAHLAGARVSEAPLPIRSESYTPQHAREALTLPQDAVVLLVMGGSQGSVHFNTHLPRILEPFLHAHPNLWIVHQTGERNLAATLAQHRQHPRVRYVPFVDAALALAAADGAITRAGYGTIADAAYHGLPLLVLPLPSAADDHQRANARALLAAGAGWWAEQDDERAIVDGVAQLLNTHTRNQAAERAHARAPRDGAAKVLALVEQALAPGNLRGGA